MSGVGAVEPLGDRVDLGAVARATAPRPRHTWARGSGRARAFVQRVRRRRSCARAGRAECGAVVQADDDDQTRSLGLPPGPRRHAPLAEALQPRFEAVRPGGVQHPRLPGGPAIRSPLGRQHREQLLMFGESDQPSSWSRSHPASGRAVPGRTDSSDVAAVDGGPGGWPQRCQGRRRCWRTRRHRRRRQAPAGVTGMSSVAGDHQPVRRHLAGLGVGASLDGDGRGAALTSASTRAPTVTHHAGRPSRPSRPSRGGHVPRPHHPQHREPGQRRLVAGVGVRRPGALLVEAQDLQLDGRGRPCGATRSSGTEITGWGEVEDRGDAGLARGRSAASWAAPAGVAMTPIGDAPGRRPSSGRSSMWSALCPCDRRCRPRSGSASTSAGDQEAALG